jgi:hypothetical protein
MASCCVRSLAFLFLTSAKVAAYHHAPAANQINSTKMTAEAGNSLAEASAQIPAIVIGSLLLALIVHGALSVTLAARRDEALPTADRWASPALAVRPPPSI